MSVIYASVGIMRTVAKYKGRVEKGKIKLLLDIKLSKDAEVIVIISDNKPKFDLTEMVKRMPVNYIDGEENFGKLEGKEFW